MSEFIFVEWYRLTLRVDTRKTLQLQVTTATSAMPFTNWLPNNYTRNSSLSPLSPLSPGISTTAAAANAREEFETDSESDSTAASAAAGTTTFSTAQQRRFELLARVRNALLFNELSDFPGAKTLTNLDIESFEYA